MANPDAPEQPVSDEDARVFEAILDRVQASTGIDFRHYKPTLLHRILEQRIGDTHTVGLPGYAGYLERHADEGARLASCFLINVTSFMRDPELFAALGARVLPALIEAARNRRGELRVWSAGCSTGEEAYSIAIVVAEALDDSGQAPPPVRILATDVDRQALAHARLGIYSAAAVADLSPERVEKYFVPLAGGRYRIHKRLRSWVVFGVHDLAESVAYSHIDLVLCRNVLIYFTRDLQQRALQLFAFALREGGWLAMGEVETADALPRFFLPDGRRLWVRRAGRAWHPALP